jgi:uncharacterized RDD family membrane protein YckC
MVIHVTSSTLKVSRSTACSTSTRGWSTSRNRRRTATVAHVDPLAGVVPRRLLQAAVDQGMIFVVFFVLLNAAIFTHRKALLWVAFALLIALPFAVLLASRSGRTPAMRITGLRIVTTAGTRPRFRAYVIRWLLMVADGALFGLVGLVVILATPRRQRVGDIVAGTLVVREAALRAAEAPVSARADAAMPR